MKNIKKLYFWIILLLATVANSQSVNQVMIGPDRFLQVNGKPLFVLGAYSLPQGYSFNQGAEFGFNLVHTSANREKWDEAFSAGMYVWHSFGEGLDLDKTHAEESKTKIHKIVAEFSNHPALLFWESMDEPAWTDKKPEQARATSEGLTQGYQFLKSLDLYHPVYLNHAPRNTVDTLRKYNTASDIVCVDIYPIIPPRIRPMFAITPEGQHGDLPNQTPSCVGEYVDKMEQVAADGQPVFIVLQGFAWDDLEPDSKFKGRYPTYQESRFMAFNAIQHGAKGLLYFGLNTVPKEHPFLQDLAKVLNEIKKLSPVILTQIALPNPKLKYRERGTTITTGIEMLCKEVDGSVYLIAANTSIYPAAADFSSLPPELSQKNELQVLGENRTVPIRNGAFFDEFEGLGVHVYFRNSTLDTR